MTLIKLVTFTLFSVVLWFVICCFFPNKQVDFLALIRIGLVMTIAKYDVIFQQ